MAPKKRKAAASPKLRGGYKQRNLGATPVVQPSKLAQWLLQQFLWGHLPATSVQQIAIAAQQDGLKHPDIQRIETSKQAILHPLPLPIHFLSTNVMPSLSKSMCLCAPCHCSHNGNECLYLYGCCVCLCMICVDLSV